MVSNKYIIVCDESNKKGSNYSYFYGGAMLLEHNYEKIGTIINDYKTKLGFNELKRTKISEKNCVDYIKVLDLFFTFVRSGDIKLRMMFAPNNELISIPKPENHTYTKFYFAFIKNAFNIFFANKNISLRLIFDDLPETKEQCDTFKQYLVEKINNNKSKRGLNSVTISASQIEEVDSTKHPILQCVDVIIGCIEFYLNTPRSQQISKRARAKFKVFDKIWLEISRINPEFNLTTTTTPIYSHKAWLKPYAHFVYHKKIVPKASTNRPRERVALRKH